MINELIFWIQSKFWMYWYEGRSIAQDVWNDETVQMYWNETNTLERRIIGGSSGLWIANIFLGWLIPGWIAFLLFILCPAVAIGSGFMIYQRTWNKLNKWREVENDRYYMERYDREKKRQLEDYEQKLKVKKQHREHAAKRVAENGKLIKIKRGNNADRHRPGEMLTLRDRYRYDAVEIPFEKSCANGQCKEYNSENGSHLFHCSLLNTDCILLAKQHACSAYERSA